MLTSRLRSLARADLVALAVSNRYVPEDAIKGSDFLKYGLPVLIVLTVIATLYQYILYSIIKPF